MSGEFDIPTAEGGCLCGAVRYRVSGDAVATTLCHCRSCRRASGGVSVAWAVFDQQAFEWLNGSPSEYSSSPGIYWRHCANCGSLVGYRRDSRPDHLDITTATLDDPDRFPPTVEIWVGDKIAWEALHPDLPKKLRSSLNEWRRAQPCRGHGVHGTGPPPELRTAALTDRSTPALAQLL